MSRDDGAAILLLLREAALRLASVDAGNPRLEAEYLLAAALGIERSVLLGLDPGHDPGAHARERFRGLLARRLAREPLQYVLGTVPFAGLDLDIGPGALIPRGETEVLVEEVARELERNGPFPETSGAAGAPLLVDVGTGSGAILLALLRMLPSWRGLGIDRSAEALCWAARNAGSRPRCALVRANLVDALREGCVAALVSNPPYVRSTEVPDLAPEIRDHEPRGALDGGADGLDPFRCLVPGAARVLMPGGLFAVELAPDQPEAASGLLRAGGRFEAIRIFRDLAGRERGVLARRI